MIIGICDDEELWRKKQETFWNSTPKPVEYMQKYLSFGMAPN